MSTTLLLVDFENVQQLDFQCIGDEFRVLIFVGAAQKAVPIELVQKAQALGPRVEWHRVDASGSNALDFFIAFHLGRLVESATKSSCTILSKDKGYDPLIRHVSRLGLRCRRINSLLELMPTDEEHAQLLNEHYSRVLELLGKSEKKTRPRKRSTLATHISAMFQKKISDAEVANVIDMLFSKSKITEESGNLTYRF